MRAKPHIAALLTLVVTGSIAVYGAAAPAHPTGYARQATDTPSPEPSSTDATPVEPTPDGTPVVDPGPPPLPLSIPAALRDHDYRAPGPVMAAADGFIHPMSAEERADCHPATHVLRERVDEESNPVVVAYPLRPNDGATVLDLYMGSYVQLIGAEDVTDDRCQIAARVIGVDRVRVLDQPGLPTPRSEP